MVGFTGSHRLGNSVVDFKDDAFRTVVAVVLLLIIAADDRERIHDVGGGVAGVGKLAFSRAISSDVSPSARSQSPFASHGR